MGAMGRMGLPGTRGPASERGTSFIEITIMTLIATILLIALAQAMKSITHGSLVSKERARALALARDRLEEVKNLGYETLSLRFSNYYYPDNPDPSNPLVQAAGALPYPTVAPPAAGEDPWTPEYIQMGRLVYWRHVVVKFVEEDGDDRQLKQSPRPDLGNSVVGGTNPSSNLVYIEVDVTWEAPQMGKQVVRLSTLLANTAVMGGNVGSISGTILDDDCFPPNCFADGNDEGGTGGNVAVPGPDDWPITWGTLLVTARNVLTDETFSGNMGARGTYTIENLPDGSYEVMVRGAPLYRLGKYTGRTSSINVEPSETVTVSAVTKSVKNVNVWLDKTRLVRIIGLFSGVDGTSEAKEVEISCNDGVSKPINYSVTWFCDPTNPCWFTINDVAWPVTGNQLYNLSITNTTDKATVGATLCMDAALLSPSALPQPNDFYVGIEPPTSDFNPCTAGTGSCEGLYPLIGADCVYPGMAGAYAPLEVATSLTRAWLTVRVTEYYNGEIKSELDPATVPLVRVAMESTNDGVSATLGVSGEPGAVGTTTFENPGLGEGLIPVQPPPTIRLKAYATTTGYTEDSYFLPFNITPSEKYNLATGDKVPNGEAYVFMLTRVSAVSGTVWITPGVKGFPNAIVRIYMGSTWSNAVTADGQGRFYHGAVPMHDGMDYYVEPQVGTDYDTTPQHLLVRVEKNGLHYRTNNPGTQPLEFTMTAINGYITGHVRRNGVPVGEGAVIIASTFNGTFPATLPSGLLSGAKTYSTVTLTDGSFKLKVATGLGNYYMYAFVREGTTDHSCGTPCVSDVTVTAGNETPVEVDVP